MKKREKGKKNEKENKSEPKKNTENKTEREKHGFWKILSNNFYMLKVAFQACPSRVISPFVREILMRFRGIFISVIFMEQIVKYIEEGADFRQTVPFLIFSVALMGLLGFFRLYDRNLNEPIGNQKLYEQLHMRMFDKAADVELSCYENPDFFNKYMKATAQIKSRANSVLWVVPALLVESLGTIYLLYKTMSIDKITIIFAIFPLISTYLFGAKMNSVKYDLYQKNLEAMRTEDYVIRSVYQREYAKELRLSNCFELLKDYFTKAVSEVVANTKKYGLKIGILNCMTDSINQVFVLAGSILYASVKLLYFKDIAVSDYIVLVNAINMIFQSMCGSAQYVTKIQDNSLYIQNIRDFMEYEPEISGSAVGKPVDKEQFDLRMENISYCYLGQEEPVLKGINISIGKKEKIALVGENGAGKTTLVKLLMRLYDPTEGRITLNGEDIRDYTVKEYRNLFGTVFQDYKVFALTIAENVMMDEVKEEDRERVRQALKDSGIYEKVQSLPKGMDSTLTMEYDREGVNLSGGEMQKIAIARVFARDCQIAILDEPSSALDPIAEYQVYESMLKACADKAVVFISHRLSSAVLADKVYMLEDGRVVEAGSHAELMEKNGKYAEMFRFQAEKYVEEV